MRFDTRNRRDWVRDNPVLEDGVGGYERETKKLKVGNGVTAWNDLRYFESPATDSGPSGGSSVGAPCWFELTSGALTAGGARPLTFVDVTDGMTPGIDVVLNELDATKLDVVTDGIYNLSGRGIVQWNAPTEGDASLIWRHNADDGPIYYLQGQVYQNGHSTADCMLPSAPAILHAGDTLHLDAWVGFNGVTVPDGYVHLIRLGDIPD